MKKELFKLRHAALASALALAMGAPLCLADEALPEAGPEVVSLPADNVDGGAVVTGDVGAPTAPDEVAVDPAPSDDGVAVVDPLPGDTVDVVPDEPVADGEVTIQDAPVEGGEVAVEDVPVDDCGMICWNAAEMPPGAVQKGEELNPEIMQFGVSGEAPEPSLNVSAELSGAVGVAEQLGASDVAIEDAANIAPLTDAAPAAAVVATAGEGRVNVIRDGHLH